MDADLTSKTIKVEYDPALASPEVMLAALQHWGTNAGKTVQLLG